MVPLVMWRYFLAYFLRACMWDVYHKKLCGIFDAKIIKTGFNVEKFEPFESKDHCALDLLFLDVQRPVPRAILY